MLQKQVILFKPKKKLDTDLKLDLCRKQLYATAHLRYFGILIDRKLNWNTQLIILFQISWEVTKFLSELTYYVYKEILRTIYFATYHFYLKAGKIRHILLLCTYCTCT